jgi:hypothetical protein
MKLKTQLAGMNANRAVFQWTISRRLVKKRLTDMLLRQFMGLAVECLLGEVLEEIAKSSALLECRTNDNPLNELPTLVT